MIRNLTSVFLASFSLLVAVSSAKANCLRDGAAERNAVAEASAQASALTAFVSYAPSAPPGGPILLSCTFSNCQGYSSSTGAASCQSAPSSRNFELTVDTPSGQAHYSGGGWFAVNAADESISWSQSESSPFEGGTYTTSSNYWISRNTLAVTLRESGRSTQYPGFFNETYTGSCQVIQRQF